VSIKFKIKTIIGQSDVDCLKEVLERRLKHKDWPWPDVVLVDGGKPQVNAIKKILQENNQQDYVLGIAKRKQRNKNEFVFSEKNDGFSSWVKDNKMLENIF